MTTSRAVATMRDALVQAVYESRPLPTWVIHLLAAADKPDAILTIFKAVQHHNDGNTPTWHFEQRINEILTEAIPS